LPSAVDRFQAPKAVLFTIATNIIETLDDARIRPGGISMGRQLSAL
jgi:ATP-dependent 26S proteasome regulatory subunit